MKEETIITANFTLEELTRSATATRKGIDNNPPGLQRHNLCRLCTEILQPIRDKWSAPIIVSSGYRCEDLNRAVGGVRNSDHLYGCAADIHTLPNTKSNNQALYNLIRKMYADGLLPTLKQCIDEHSYQWLHIALQDGRTAKRGEFLHIS